MEDFMMAFEEVKPAFGAVRDTLESYRLNGIIDYGESFQHLTGTCNSLVEQARTRAYALISARCTGSSKHLLTAHSKPCTGEPRGLNTVIMMWSRNQFHGSQQPIPQVAQLPL